MGNTQCIATNSWALDSSSATKSGGAKESSKFYLQIHQEDSAAKSIIDPGAVENFFHLQEKAMKNYSSKIVDLRTANSSGHSTASTKSESYSSYRSESDGSIRIGSQRIHGENMALVQKCEFSLEGILLGDDTARKESHPKPLKKNIKASKEPLTLQVTKPLSLSGLLDPDSGKSISWESSVLHFRLRSCAGEYLKRKLLASFPRDLLAEKFLQNIRKSDINPSVFLFTDSSTLSSHSAESGSLSNSLPRPITLMATDQPFLGLEVLGSLGISRSKKSERGRRCQYLVIYDRAKKDAVAVCAVKKEASTGPPFMRIYTPKQRVQSQESSFTTAQIGIDWLHESPLYTFCEIASRGCSYPDLLRLHAYMALAGKGKFERDISYQVSQVSQGCPEFRIYGKTSHESSMSGCALVTQCQNEDDGELFWKLSAVRGIDPILMTCMVYFIDEILQRQMERRFDQCKQAVKQN